MILDSLPAILGLTGVAGLVSALIVYGLGRVLTPTRSAARALIDAAGPGTVFLFEGQILVDATQPALRLIARKERNQSDWDALIAILARQFPDFPPRLSDLPASGRISAAGKRGGELVVADYCEGLLRLSLTMGGVGDNSSDRLVAAAMEDELETLRSIAEDAPQLIWKENADGEVIWANRAYLDLMERLFPTAADDDPVWHCRPALDMADRSGPVTEGPTRVSLRVPGAATPQWFEVTSVRRGVETIRFAVDANSAVAAENTRGVFVQTLTKTFAHLATGLVIFDRQRRLVLFNPAFLDLTGLSAGFLSSRPQVQTVLDRLRDLHMLPEPKNYTTWRDQVAAFEAQASEGTYCETWSLPSGLTYRVTGRPHPEGAIAFLFEDISDDVALTRRYRSEQETAQAVFDSLEDGIAVFSVGGTMILCNAAYQATFGTSVEGLNDTTLNDKVRDWQAMAQPSPVWGEILRFIRGRTERVDWRGTFQLQDGRPFALHLSAVTGGATIARFRSLATEKVPGKVPFVVAVADTNESEGASFRSGRHNTVVAKLSGDLLLDGGEAQSQARSSQSVKANRLPRSQPEGDVRPQNRRRSGPQTRKTV